MFIWKFYFNNGWTVTVKKPFDRMSLAHKYLIEELGFIHHTRTFYCDIVRDE